MRKSLGNQSRGFSLVELMVVVVIILIILAAGFLQIAPIIRNARADTALNYTLNQMRHTRERAIDERRRYELDFVAPRSLIIRQGNKDQFGVIQYANAGAPSDQYQQLDLPPDMQFGLPGTLPVVAPDALGTQQNPVDFTLTGSANPATSLFFSPDGSVADNVGGITNGVVYIARPNDNESCRAVSLFGSTGRLKAWKLIGNTWTTK
jgi:prepilin-type N-terminal cleavage/methylation domain-containing protein